MLIRSHKPAGVPHSSRYPFKKNKIQSTANLPVLAAITCFTLFRFGAYGLHQAIPDIGKINRNFQIGKEARLQFPICGQAKAVAFNTGQGPLSSIGVVTIICLLLYNKFLAPKKA